MKYQRVGGRGARRETENSFDNVASHGIAYARGECASGPASALGDGGVAKDKTVVEYPHLISGHCRGAYLHTKRGIYSLAVGFSWKGEAIRGSQFGVVSDSGQVTRHIVRAGAPIGAFAESSQGRELP